MELKVKRLQEENLLLGFELRGLFDAMPQLGWSAQADGAVDFYNRGWYEYTGTTFEEMQGWGWQTVHDPEMLPSVVARWQESIRIGAPFEMEFPLRRHDGQFRWFLTRVNPIRDASGTIVRWVGINSDIDDQKRSQDKAQYDLATFFEMSLDLLCIAGFDGFYKRLNPSWTATLGFSAEELKAKPWLDFVHPDDVAATVAAGAQLSKGAKLISFTNRYACKDGTYRWIDWRAAPAMELGLIYAAARDITAKMEADAERAALQKRLMVADRMASVGTLAAGIAHEINNPLSYVTSNLDMVLEEIFALSGGSSSGRMKDLEGMAKDAREGADRVRKIVRGLKTFSRVDDEVLTVLDVKPVLELAINMAFNEIRHRARLVKDYGPTPLVLADDARLGQVFVNLLVNAAHALSEENDEANEIRIVTSTDLSGRAVVEVRDTGSGIPEDIIDRVFDPFFTTKAIGIGTGLGLSISQNIVMGMGGELTVRSQVGRGTTFAVALRASPDQRLPSTGESQLSPAAGKRAAILVVDDEPAVGVAMGRVLREHEVVIVTSVSEALRVLGTGKRFDVIFSDLMMPRTTGMDFYRELLQRSPRDAARIVFVTGGACTSEASKFLDSVSNERLEKPFAPKSVRALVQRFLK